jgi:hypothetical protein
MRRFRNRIVFWFQSARAYLADALAVQDSTDHLFDDDDWDTPHGENPL